MGNVNERKAAAARASASSSSSSSSSATTLAPRAAAPPRDTSLEARHAVPLGLYPKCPWDHKTLHNAIVQRKLAPIFKGAEEPSDDDMEECPICMLWYPHGLNRVKCCRQDICTECYLQIKKPDDSVATCPFCNQDGFATSYSGLKSRVEKEKDLEEARKVAELQERMRIEEQQRDEERRREREQRALQAAAEPPPPPPPAPEPVSVGVPEPAAIANYYDEDLFAGLDPNDPADQEEIAMLRQAIQLSLLDGHR